MLSLPSIDILDIFGHFNIAEDADPYHRIISVVAQSIFYSFIVLKYWKFNPAPI